MNEEKLKRDLNKELCFDENMVGYKVMNNYIDKAIKIGKLEQKKEDKTIKDEFYNEFDLASNCSKDDKLFKRLWNKYFKQLQKEIGEEKQDENIL